MTRVLDAEAVIRATDRTGGVFQQVANKIKRMAAAAKSASRLGDIAERGALRAEGAAAASTRMLSIPAARYLAPAAAAAALVSSTKRFASAEMALTRIGITANASDEEIANLHKTVRDLSFDTAKPFDEVADGLDQIVAGGVDLDKAKAQIGPIVKTAQAAGAEIRDISNSALALTQNLDIAEDKMQRAFDVLVAGGKAGKFELKDMARYLPSIAPAAAAVGMKGEEGLKRIVTLLQVVRAGSGNAEEAAASVQNIFAKMESEETAKNFKEFGVDLRKEMETARKGGRDLLEVFAELTEKATKGDQSKLPQLISDMQFARGMRALMSYRDLAKQVRGELDNADGSAMKDFGRVMQRSKSSIDQVTESVDRAKDAIGRLMVAAGATKAIDIVSQKVNEISKEAERPADERRRDGEDHGDIHWMQGLQADYLSAISKLRAEKKSLEQRGTGGPGGDRSDDPAKRRAIAEKDAGIAELYRRFNAAAVEIAGLRARMASGANAAAPSLFTDTEVKNWREQFAERDSDFIGPKSPSHGTPLPAADPRGANRGLVVAPLDLNDKVTVAPIDLADKIKVIPVAPGEVPPIQPMDHLSLSDKITVLPVDLNAKVPDLPPLDLSGKIAPVDLSNWIKVQPVNISAAVNDILRRSVEIDQAKPAAAAPSAHVGGWDKPSVDIAAIAQKIDSRPVEAELKGAASVTVAVEVKAGDGLLASIRNTVSNAIGHLRMGGSPASGSTGSTGKSMPESKTPM